jgi:hypothetical protein
VFAVAVATVAGTLKAEMATFIAIEALGDPIPGGSWFQDLHITSNAAFTGLGVGLTDSNGDLYFGLVNSPEPAMDFANGSAGWAQTVFVPSVSPVGLLAESAGPATTELVWRTHFADPTSEPFTMAVFATVDNGILFDSATATWDGSSWSYNSAPGMSWQQFQQIAGEGHVPAPSAALLGMMGLGLVGLVSRRGR